MSPEAGPLPILRLAQEDGLQIVDEDDLRLALDVHDLFDGREAALRM